VARNRKRAKERRARRPQPVVSRARDEAAERSGPPSPLGQAAPDAEQAELAERPPGLPESELIQPLDLDNPELTEAPQGVEFDDQEEPEDNELEPTSGGGGRGPRSGDDGDDGEGPPEGPGSELEATGGPVDEPRARSGNRLILFLQGSWRELQRVQWPDRRQVMQATGVVIGFVIVAGLLLGAADFVSGKVINLILYGHT
jgi:preprotein translocase subunit SecE